MKQPAFPENFLWGASTAGHQVDGGLHDQWTEWELINAKQLARAARTRLSSTPDRQDVMHEAERPENYISGRGVDHYRRYEEDFSILRSLHMNAFRFSIEWSRIEPKEGVWDERAIEHYRRYLANMKRLGIEPVVTLWHWTMPVWFVAKGDFEKRKNLRYFNRFVEKIAHELGSDITYVTLLNEPNVHISESYIRGVRPPELHNPLLAARVFYHLAVAHRRAYRIIKQQAPHIQVGIACAFGDIRPARVHNFLDWLFVRVMRYGANWWFVDRIRHQLDFIGVNYYFTSYVKWTGKVCNPSEPVNDLGWYMQPGGLADITTAVWSRYHKPILITENGLADAQDAHRQWWLEQTTEALRRVIRSGVDLRGYLHWSLLDNFEWESGWWPKFGLVAVDRKTMKRTIRPSAKWLAGYIEKTRFRPNKANKV